MLVQKVGIILDLEQINLSHELQVDEPLADLSIHLRLGKLREVQVPVEQREVRARR